MQKFYKFFTLTTFAAVFVYGGFHFLTGAFAPGAAAQNKTNPGFTSPCDNHSVLVLMDNADRTVHVAYDFNRGTVSTVQLQKGFSPPEISVRTKNLAP